MADDGRRDRDGRRDVVRGVPPWERRARNWEDWHAREREEGQDGRGYGGLNEWSYRDRGPGRVFDRGEDYGRADPRGEVGRAGEPPRDRRGQYRGQHRGGR